MPTTCPLQPLYHTHIFHRNPDITQTPTSHLPLPIGSPGRKPTNTSKDKEQDRETQNPIPYLHSTAKLLNMPSAHPIGKSVLIVIYYHCPVTARPFRFHHVVNAHGHLIPDLN